jgi:hypothetical protein
MLCAKILGVLSLSLGIIGRNHRKTLGYGFAMR